MSTRNYPLNRGEPKRLEITTSAHFKNTIVRLDGNPIGSLSTKQELESGKRFPLGDGSWVRVQLTGKAWSGRRIEVTRDGRPLPGSPSDPYLKLWAVSIAVFLIAGVNLLGGLIIFLSYTAASQSQAAMAGLQTLGIGLASIIGLEGVVNSLGSPAQTLGIGLVSLIGGALYLVLGFFVRHKSNIALGIAVAVYALNLAVSVIVSVSGADLIGIVGIAIGILWLTVMSRGFRAIDSIRVEEETIQRQAT